ncbi:MAG: choice-of-anchor tandem repeat GloVer-containing protein [Candidatus Sulfotelmatobacter sp.]
MRDSGYSFGGGTDGVEPLGGLIFDSAGNLYGTTADGGAANAGTVFEITP